MKYRLGGSLDGTSEEISYVFSFVSYSCIKAITEAYIGGSIFQVPLVSDYSTCYANRVPTHSVQQLRVYAFDAPTTTYASLHQPLVYKALTNQGGGALVYRPRSLP